MKYLFYLSSLVLVIACSRKDSEPKTEIEEITSALTFKMDYGSWEMSEEKNYSDFESLFKSKEVVRLANIDVMNGTENVYDFNQGLGDIEIKKGTEGTYEILEYFIIPIGSVYGKVALLRYLLDAKAGTVSRDKEFNPQLHVYKYWYNHIEKEYDNHLSDTAYTSKNWKSVPHDAYDEMRFLMFNLTLAAIEGCVDCKDRMGRITKDYSFVQSAEYGQNLLVCNAILKKFEE